MNTSQLSIKAQLLGRATEGRGISARETIEAGETIAVWGGEVLTREELAHTDPRRVANSLQIGERSYLVPIELSAADYVNHSCEPNAGLSGDRTLVAMRDIKPGEEISYDYAMSDDSDYDQFECRCATMNCRGQVTGGEWRLANLQDRYQGYFSSYIQSLIDRRSQDALDIASCIRRAPHG